MYQEKGGKSKKVTNAAAASAYNCRFIFIQVCLIYCSHRASKGMMAALRPHQPAPPHVWSHN